ncbi:Laccase-14 [Vitis vinifera]|uniref:Laccase-14 n=1 Tax=Vitis vinifera TaxID=29760 RepID=A0A438BN44_VITVI|nr:Laccase-14 [Vitis vinifera]
MDSGAIPSSRRNHEISRTLPAKFGETGCWCPQKVTAAIKVAVQLSPILVLVLSSLYKYLSSIHVKEQISRAIRNSKKIEGVVFRTREAFLPKKMWLIMKVKEASYTRLCSTKNILTVNGQFPGPTIYAKKERRSLSMFITKERKHHIHGRQWWKSDANVVRDEALATGADPNASDSLLINGQPDTFKLTVDHGKTYLLRIINAALHEALFFSIAKHKMTVVGTDAKTYSIAPAARNFFDNTTTTAIVQYRGYYTPSSPLSLPYLPTYNDTNASVQVMTGLRSLADAEHPCNVPLSPSTKLIYTVGMNSYLCPNNSCAGPNGTRFSASINNISFQFPTIDILQAYYYNISGVYGDKFPSVPELVFDFTTDIIPLEYQTPKNGTEVRVLEYNSTVEIVFQGTNLIAGTHHPMHLHGYSFYVVGWGFGNFDKDKDPLHYNLVDPPLQSTISVLRKVGLQSDSRHPTLTWGMDTAFIVKNGKHPEAQVLPPPSDMPPC